jgi:hypothetical protein
VTEPGVSGRTDFLQVSFWHETTGVAAPGFSTQYRLWDLSNGMEVDPWSWNIRAGGRENFDPAAGPCVSLREIARSGRAVTTARITAAMGRWELTLENEGISFAEEAWGEGYCERSFVIPYGRARRRFLRRRAGQRLRGCCAHPVAGK